MTFVSSARLISNMHHLIVLTNASISSFYINIYISYLLTSATSYIYEAIHINDVIAPLDYIKVNNRVNYKDFCLVCCILSIWFIPSSLLDLLEKRIKMETIIALKCIY